MKNLTAETRRRGENLKKSTTETQRHGDAATRKTLLALAAAVLGRVIPTIRAALREIFDESAYDRFLSRTHASRSTASYREFTRERDVAMLKKPRCC
jgi:hypothetical protein